MLKPADSCVASYDDVKAAVSSILGPASLLYAVKHLPPALASGQLQVGFPAVVKSNLPKDSERPCTLEGVVAALLADERHEPASCITEASFDARFSDNADAMTALAAAKAAKAAEAEEESAEAEEESAAAPITYATRAAETKYNITEPYKKIVTVMCQLVQHKAKAATLRDALYTYPKCEAKDLTTAISKSLKSGRLVDALPHNVKVINFPTGANLEDLMPNLTRTVVSSIQTQFPDLMGPDADLVHLLPDGFYDRFKLYLNLAPSVTDIHVDDCSAWNVILWAALTDEQLKADADPVRLAGGQASAVGARASIDFCFCSAIRTGGRHVVLRARVPLEPPARGPRRAGH